MHILVPHPVNPYQSMLVIYLRDEALGELIFKK